MSFFDDRAEVRITEKQKEKIERYITKYPDRWENASEFIRAALEREFRRLASDEGVFL